MADHPAAAAATHEPVLPTPHLFGDGGAARATRFRWVILGLLFLGTTINYVDRLVMGILAPQLQAQYSIGDVEYGYIQSAFAICYAFGQLVSGGILDKVGTRVGYGFSLLAWSVASMLHALARSALGFGIMRGLLGVAESPNFPAATKTIAEWFPKRERAFAMGFVNAGSNVGAVLAPAVVPWLANTWGWQSAFIVTGGIGILWLGLWFPLYRRPHEHPAVNPAELALINSDPEDSATPALRCATCGYDLSGNTATIACPECGGAVDDYTRGRLLFEGSAQGPAHAPPRSKFAEWADLLHHRQTWAFAIGKFLTDSMWWFYMTWIPKFLNKEHGLDLKTIGLPLVVIYLMADVGSVGGGWLSSGMIKRGVGVNAARKTALLVSACFALPIFFASQVTGLWTAVVLIGLATAAHQGFSSNLYTLVSDMFPRRAVGSVSGLGGTCGYLGASLFQIVVGYLVDQQKNYFVPFICAAFAYLVAFAAIHILAPRLEPARLGEAANA